MTLRLLVFDVDGTLVDSQAHIVAAMTDAFGSVGLPAPDRAAVRAIIGLSLPEAMRVLADEAGAEIQTQLVSAYKAAYVALRAQGGAEAGSPLFPGALDALAHLAQKDMLLMGVATGKSRRGLYHLFEAYDLKRYFVTAQVADDHPSKPHPSMLEQASAEAGVDMRDVVMLGDTVFDMEMARAAGAVPLGVGWGYHSPEDLRATGAVDVLETFDGLAPALEKIWRMI